MAVIRVHRGGEITIPAEVRDEAYLYPRDELHFTLDCDGRLTVGDYEDDELRAHPASDWRYWSGRGRITPTNSKSTGRVMSTEEFLAHLDALAAEPRQATD